MVSLEEAPETCISRFRAHNCAVVTAVWQAYVRLLVSSTVQYHTGRSRVR
jgi:hypothetical protein